MKIVDIEKKVKEWNDDYKIPGGYQADGLGPIEYIKYLIIVGDIKEVDEEMKRLGKSFLLKNLLATLEILEDRNLDLEKRLKTIERKFKACQIVG